MTATTKQTNKGASIGVLLKKQITERFSFTKKGNKTFDIGGLLLSLFLAVVLIFVFVFVFTGFAENYLKIEIDYVKDQTARMYELLTIGYAVVFLIAVFSGIGSINHALFENDDIRLFSAMPIKSTTIFMSKLIGIYLKQILVAIFTILPLNLTLASVGTVSSSFYWVTVLMCFILPLISLAISSVFALPVYFLKKYINNKYILTLILVTFLLAVLFLAYSQFLDALEELLITGKIRFFFTAEVMASIATLTTWLVPSNFCASITLSVNSGLSWLWVLLTVLVATALAIVMVKVMFNRAMQNRLSSAPKYKANRKQNHRKRSELSRLLNREFRTVIRTPNYAFQYFSIAVVMPLMVYLCMELGVKLVYSLIYVSCSFELAIFLTLVFGTLTNTFCATNISRDGTMLFAIKAMPIKHKTFMYSKVLFSLIPAIFSNIATVVVVGAVGHLNHWQCIFIAVVGIILSFSQIMIATRLDLNHPTISTEDDGEIKGSNNIISIITIVGLTVSILIGGSVLYFSIFQGLNKDHVIVNSTLFTILVVGIISLALAGFSVWFMHRKLDEQFDKLGGKLL